MGESFLPSSPKGPTNLIYLCLYCCKLLIFIVTIYYIFMYFFIYIYYIVSTSNNPTWLRWLSGWMLQFMWHLPLPAFLSSGRVLTQSLFYPFLCYRLRTWGGLTCFSGVQPCYRRWQALSWSLWAGHTRVSFLLAVVKSWLPAGASVAGWWILPAWGVVDGLYADFVLKPCCWGIAVADFLEITPNPG